MKRYAFIDVSNTKETTKTVFNFSVDWEKLVKFLKNKKWRCEKIFYYEGSTDNRKFDNRHKRLRKSGYEIRTKLAFFQKNKERKVRFTCKNCTEENSFDDYKFNCKKCGQETKVDLNNKGTHPKANFDVEIAVDALSYASKDSQIIFFTGDGDFRYLAEKLVDSGAVVIFVSTYNETIKDRRKRFSTRLKELITLEETQALKQNKKPRVRFLEIDNFKHLIAKEQKENAAKRDVSE